MKLGIIRIRWWGWIAWVACSVAVLPAAAVAAQTRETGRHGRSRGSRITLAIKAPAADVWLTRSPARVIATVADRGSRIRKVTCNARRARLKGRRVICEVPLRRGANVIRVRAVDRAGSVRVVRRRVHFGAGLIAGGTRTAALTAIGDSYDRSFTVRPGRTVLDGPLVARTMVEVAFWPQATVAQLDPVLSAVHGRIVGSLAGVAILEVQIPDTRTLAGLQAVIGRLERARRVVRYVNEAVMPSGDALPSNISATSNPDLQKVAGSLAINAPAAWNAAGAIDPANRPTVVVGDLFGGGVPDFELDAEGLTASMFSIGSAAEAHGYAVAGVIAGSFGGDSSGRGQVTGVFPARTRMRVVDATLVPAQLFDDKLIQTIRAAAPANVVVNTSLNECATTSTGQACLTGPQLRDLALAWIEKVRGTGNAGVAGAGLEGKFLQSTSAGNINNGPSDSQSNSAYDAAHELTDLVEPNGTPVPPLSNVLTVEGDFAEDPASTPPGIDCLDATSKRPGDVSAVGDVQKVGGLWSLTGATAGAGFEGGTSFATPQVAALAEYVWTLEPRLAPKQLAQLLKDTAQRQLAFLAADPGCDQNAAPAPAIDAYQALLSLDTTQLPLPGSDQPVRTALLDSSPVAGKHEFREDDLADFLFIYFDSNGDPVQPMTRDYGRYDLNGDGFTGGSTTASFDLDRTGSTLWGKTKLATVHQMILGQDVSFDETALTDLQILCYYAYSPLYVGDTQFRDTGLGPHCVPPDVKITGGFTQVISDSHAQACGTGDTGPDSPPVTAITGPFSYTHAPSPTSQTFACNPSSDGSASDSTGGSFTSSGSVGFSGMTLTQTSSGHTTARANYPGNPTIAPAEADGNVVTRTQVDFTLTATTRYTFTGAFTSTQGSGVFYSLTRTDICCSTVFDQTSGGVNPSLNGTLQPGTYEYQASGQATNRKPDQAGAGTATDSFSYGFTFKVS